MKQSRSFIFCMVGFLFFGFWAQAQTSSSELQNKISVIQKFLKEKGALGGTPFQINLGNEDPQELLNFYRVSFPKEKTEVLLVEKENSSKQKTFVLKQSNPNGKTYYSLDYGMDGQKEIFFVLPYPVSPSEEANFYWLMNPAVFEIENLAQLIQLDWQTNPSIQYSWKKFKDQPVEGNFQSRDQSSLTLYLGTEKNPKMEYVIFTNNLGVVSMKEIPSEAKRNSQETQKKWKTFFENFFLKIQSENNRFMG